MTVKYKTVITKAGAEKLAAATVPNKKKVNFTAMAVGDGGGALPVPDASQTKLVNEVWRHELNKISQDNKNQNYVIAELLIPPETGGFWMREMGLYDDAGTLIAVGNMAESYKPLLAEGSGRAQTVRMVVMVSNIDSIELSIDTSLVMATQDYVDDKLAEHEESRRHPDATTKDKGFTQLSNATDSSSETLAATSKAVKAVYDLATGKYTAQDATTAQKGIVQLSSATDSPFESLAATPKAVKAVSDDIKTLKNSLGDAAFRNIAENATGALIPVGYKGNFKSECNHGVLDFATYPFVVGEALFIDVRGCTNNPPFLNQDYYYIKVICATSPAQGGRVNRPLIQFVSYTNSIQVLAIREDDGVNIGWRYFSTVQYDSGSKTVTTPGSIRAFNGATELSQNAIIIRGENNKHLWFFRADNQEAGLVYAGDDKVLRLRGGGGPSLNISPDGSVVAGGYLGALADIHSNRNISSDGFIQSAAGLYDTPGVRVYSPNNPPPKQDLSPYATTAWVQGSFASSAWTIANFLQGGLRLASLGVATNGNNDNEFAYAPNGTVVTAVQQKTNYTAVQYRSLQYNIGGNWYTAWVA
ncbi:phage tail protein [Enterobacter asburiae]|uniref:phage tail protein n=1 Tax=Enterobacter asburiae TaxID=61645 RepID=UPI0026665518|nr:phage tail protein [Enterobacter asburiae]MDO2454698.1 phage tail protein [Enterobacter asburiae]